MRAVLIRVYIGAVAASMVLAAGCGDDNNSGGGAPVVVDQDASVDDAGGDVAESPDATTPDATTPDATTPDATTPDTAGDDTGGEGPGGRTGLEGFCDHYVDCGGTYYSDADACIDASINYWGECRRDELDTFGDCMMNVDCDDWNPDTYNPANTDCSEEWSAVRQASCD